HPGAAILSGTASETALAFEGNGGASGLVLQGFKVGASFSTGSIAVSDTTCSNVVTCMYVPRTATSPQVTLSAVSVTGGARAVEFTGVGANVTWTGGDVQQIATGDCLGAIKVTDATVVVDNLVMHDSDAPAAFGLGNADLTIQNSTLTDMFQNKAMVWCQA